MGATHMSGLQTYDCATAAVSTILATQIPLLLERYNTYKGRTPSTAELMPQERSASNSHNFGRFFSWGVDFYPVYKFQGKSKGSFGGFSSLVQ